MSVPDRLTMLNCPCATLAAAASANEATRPARRQAVSMNNPDELGSDGQHVSNVPRPASAVKEVQRLTHERIARIRRFSCRHASQNIRRDRVLSAGVRSTGVPKRQSTAGKAAAFGYPHGPRGAIDPLRPLLEPKCLAANNTTEQPAIPLTAPYTSQRASPCQLVP